MTPLQSAARQLSIDLSGLRFAPPVTHVYDPLTYAWATHAEYLARYGEGRKCVVFLGMNPGPFGMVQTGVPFGEVSVVRDWLGIEDDFGRKVLPLSPELTNPARPIEGFACQRSEVSGRRLWGLFSERFVTADTFFADHFVANYCPLAFFDKARNLTPDKLPGAEQAPLLAACDAHLRAMVEIIRPQWLIGVGAWAESRARQALCGMDVQVGRILHPSPASPAANRGWSAAATQQLVALGVWNGL